MTAIIGSNLGKRFGPLDVFQGVNLRVEKGDRIGLVGPNGEGKTTLLRIMADLDSPTEGSVHRMRGLTIGYLPQDPPLAGDQTLWDDVSAQFGHLEQQAQALRDLEERMADPVGYEDALVEYGSLQARFEAAGGYQWELTVRQVLTGLGFAPDEHTMPLSYLSGGQRTRALLARLLLQHPDLLLLDEPTNHLDLQATEWLEQTLLQWPGSIVAVSHDRFFLDRVATRIWDLADQRLEVYRGNYSHYAQQREAQRERQAKEWQRQQAFVAKEEDYIRRNIAGQNTRQAQGRRTRLERLRQEGGLVERPRAQRTISLDMDARLRSGNLVLSTRDLVIGYRQAAGANGTPPRREDVSGGYQYQATRQPVSPGDSLLFRCQPLELRRGERVALLGPNGAGKSTFVRTILGEVPPLAGRLRVGASVRLGYLAQAHSDLPPDMTVLDAILQRAPRMEIGRARGLLGRYLFSGDDVFKPIAALSGGQRSRVALARLTLEGANLLLLDEPTNHLDIASQEVLEDVLKGFPGTVLLVTHDRYLVDALATQVWMIDRGELRVYPGNYSHYLESLAAAQAEAQKSQETAELTDAQRHRVRARQERRQRKVEEQRQQEAQRLEDLIHGLEQRLEAISGQLTEASELQQVQRIQVLGQEYEAVERRLQQLMDEWSALAG